MCKNDMAMVRCQNVFAADAGQERDQISPDSIRFRQSRGQGPRVQAHVGVDEPEPLGGRGLRPPDAPPRFCPTQPGGRVVPATTWSGASPLRALSSRRRIASVESVDSSSTSVIAAADSPAAEAPDGRRDVILLRCEPGRSPRRSVAPGIRSRGSDSAQEAEPGASGHRDQAEQRGQTRQRRPRPQQQQAVAIIGPPPTGFGLGRLDREVTRDPLGGDLAALDHHRHPGPRLDATPDEVEPREVLAEVERAESCPPGRCACCPGRRSSRGRR